MDKCSDSVRASLNDVRFSQPLDVSPIKKYGVA
jgi:hypothetical protein